MKWDRVVFVALLALGALVAALIFAVPESPHESRGVHLELWTLLVATMDF